MIADQQERRAGHPGEQAAEVQAAGADIGHGLGALQHLQIGPERMLRAGAGGDFGGARLLQREQHRGGHQRAEPAQHPEDRAPAAQGHDQPAHDGGQDRPQAPHQHDHRQHAGRLPVVVAVADDGAGHDHGGARPHRLDEAQGDHRPHRVHDRAADAGHQVHGDADQQDRPPSDPVGPGAIDQLAQRQAQEEGGQSGLALSRRPVQLRGQLRQGRQIDVGGHRRKRRQRPEQQQESRRSQHDQLATASGGAV